MTTLRRSVSSISALATFEAAARLGGFTLAAEELGVSQAAVSRQVKLLERELNTPLFIRAHRRVILTPAGETLAAAVTAGFDRMTEAIQTIRQPHLPGLVTIGGTLAFCHFWLMPRLPAFRAAHPDIRLRLVAEDAVSDLRRDRLDVAVRYGRPPFDDAVLVSSHSCRVFPVCAPGLRDRAGGCDSPESLAHMPLIASDWADPAWLSWRNFARMAGLGPALARMADLSRLRVNHYADTIHAAIAGEGVALGWSLLLGDMLGDGRLVSIGGVSVTPAEGYHLLTPAGRPATAATQVFLDWATARLAACNP